MKPHCCFHFLCQPCIVAAALFLAAVASGMADPPPNDSFLSPAIISGFPVSAVASNIEASFETSEQQPDGFEGLVTKSVWFQWTATTSGIVQIDTFGSAFTNVVPFPFRAAVGVWTGNDVSALTEIRGGGSPQSKYVSVNSGTTYRIAVYGRIDDFFEEGNILLNITNDTSSHITGTITHLDGTTPIEGIIAQASRFNGAWWEQVTWGFTDASGSYTILGLTGGTYRVGFYDWLNRFGTPVYLTEFYNDVSSAIDLADDIVVPAASVVSGIDASLAEASKITGIVTGPDGVIPLQDIEVFAYQWDGYYWNWISSGSSYADGHFEISGLSAGTYRVGYADYLNGDYASEFFNDAVFIDFGSDVSVPLEGTISNISVSLSLAAKISGNVAGADGGSMLYGYVLAYKWDGSNWQVLALADVDDDGNYLLTGLPGGTYRLEFNGPNGDYVQEYSGGTSNVETAADITVPEGVLATNINAALSLVLPLVVGIQRDDPSGSATFLFTGVYGRSYVLQQASSLTGEWSDVSFPAGCFDATNPLSITVPDDGRAVFRLRRDP